MVALHVVVVPESKFVASCWAVLCVRLCLGSWGDVFSCLDRELGDEWGFRRAVFDSIACNLNSRGMIDSAHPGLRHLVLRVELRMLVVVAFAVG